MLLPEVELRTQYSKPRIFKTYEARGRFFEGTPFQRQGQKQSRPRTQFFQLKVDKFVIFFELEQIKRKSV